ncbi:MAG: NAD(P)-binding domain-containing protein [Polyangiaceae bacterium]
MKVGVFGTGIVGQTIAGKLLSLGHSVMIGTRDPAATLARAEKDMLGFPPFRDWHAQHPEAKLGTMAETAAFGELCFNVLNGQGAIAALESAGADKLAGKVLVDVTNPLDFSKGFPPSLFVSNTDSLGEQIQRALPRTRVVKTLNTVNAFVMVDPKLVAGEHTMFVAGNDADAKATVSGLLREGFGWSDLVDLGDITGARATEGYLLLWVRLFGSLKNGQFNIRVVR